MNLIKAAALLAVLASASPRPFDDTIWDNLPDSLPPGVVHSRFHSEAMNADVGFNIYLPPDYERHPGRRYPVIYFLHGRNGDENAELSGFADFLAVEPAPEAIIVFPNGGKNSKYLDATPGSNMRGVIMMETAITRELIPHVDRSFRTDARRERRSVQGFSMGGLGALRLAFQHPDLFGSVYAAGPAVDDTVENIADGEPQLLQEMLGGRTELWGAHMPLAVATENASRIRGRVAICISIGDQDGQLPFVQDLSRGLRALGLAHTLEIIPGRGHTHAFSDRFALMGGAGGGCPITPP